MKLPLLAALLAAPALATAHDLWVERAPDGFVARYGHHDAPLDLDARKVKAIRCADGSGPARDVLGAARFAPKEVRVAATCTVVSVFHDGGYWSLTPDGEVNRPRTAATDVIRAWASRQYAKWVDARQAGAGATVLGDELELVSATDLARVHAGDKLTLRVLSAGSPVRGAIVAIDHHALGESDSKGEVRVRVRSAGVETISASVRHVVATPEADAEVLEASLTLEVPR